MGASVDADAFPEDDCRRILSELSVWTSVDDCLAAARWLENRSEPEDSVSPALVVPYPDEERFETVFIHCLNFLIKGFQTPPIKVRLATLVDPQISSRTSDKLLGVQFKPDIDGGRAGMIGTMFPSLADHNHERFFVIKDEPYIIELIQNPVRCLLDLLNRAWSTASEMRSIQELSEETGSSPTIFHQPYTDGPLPALTEALTFSVNGLTIGPIDSSQQGGINRGYRSFEVVGRPPIDARLFEAGQEMTKIMFDSLE